MSDTIKYSSRYYDIIRIVFLLININTFFSMLNANIRGIAINLDKFKLLPDEILDLLRRG